MHSVSQSYISHRSKTANIKFCDSIRYNESYAQVCIQSSDINVKACVCDDMTSNHGECSSILTKFDRPMQNDMPMTKLMLKSKPEVEFQYDCRPFSETGSSFFISAVD